MRSLTRRLGLYALLLGAVGVPIACAAEGGSGNGNGDDEAEPSPTAVPGDSSAIPPHDADGGAPIVEAGPCGASMLCPVSLPTADDVALTSIWGSSATDVWAVGSGGTVLHYDGTNWEKAMLEGATPNGSTSFTLRSVWLGRADDVWIADGDGVRHATGWKGPNDTEWSFLSYPTGECKPTSIRGIGNTVWIGRGLVLQKSNSCPWQLGRFDGWGDAGPYTVPNVMSAGLGTPILISVAVSQPDEGWASVNTLPTPTIPGGNRLFRLRSGVKWETEEFDSRTRKNMPGVWGDEHAVWLAGEGGTLRRILRANVPGKTFEAIPSPVTTNLNDVFGFGADDVWAVGEASTVIHWDGTSWSKLSTPFDDSSNKPHLRAVWGSSPNDVWIVGDRTILHHQGSAP